MYRFSSDARLAVDVTYGSLMVIARGESHGEMLDSFFIVPLHDIPNLVGGQVVLEEPSTLNGTKWKPKTIQLSGDHSKITVTDPDHQMTNEKGRKKNVVGSVELEISPKNLLDLVEKSTTIAFFEITVMPANNSDDRKKYNRELKKWVEFSNKFFDTELLMRSASPGYYNKMPMGQLAR